jgi:ABC-three component (ABC-3C) system Middle Component 2
VGAVSAPTQTFNTPLEAGLRALFLLTAADKRSLEVQRLMYFDYAMVHTGDFDGPPSLHPPTPSQGSQLFVRRALIQEGLELMRSRDLVERRFLAAGIRWRVTRVGRHVAAQFSSDYAASLRARAEWVLRTLGEPTDVELARLFAGRVRPLEDELIAARTTEGTPDA